MNQGGREFYIHQSQEAEKWHCLVTRKRLIIYTERERVGERGESTLQTGFAVLGIFAQATQGTQSVHKHMTSIVTWCDMIIIAVSDPNTCADSACERGDILHRLMPMWTSAASGTNGSDGVWSVCMRSHCNFPSPKLSCQINTPLISRHHTTSILSIRIPLLCRAHCRALRILKSCLTVRCSKVLNRLHLRN